MINRDMDIVAEVLHRIRTLLGEETFSLWFGAEKVYLSFRDGLLGVNSALPLVLEWNRRKYMKDIARIASEAAGCAVKVEFHAMSEEEFFIGSCEAMKAAAKTAKKGKSASAKTAKAEKTEKASKTGKKTASAKRAAGKTAYIPELCDCFQEPEETVSSPAPSSAPASRKKSASVKTAKTPAKTSVKTPVKTENKKSAAPRASSASVLPMKNVPLLAELAKSGTVSRGVSSRKEVYSQKDIPARKSAAKEPACEKPKRTYRTSAAIRHREDSRPSQAEKTAKIPSLSGDADYRRWLERISSSGTIPHPAKKQASAEDDRQKTLGPNTFRTFVEGPSNSLAVTTAKNLLNNPAGVSMLIFYGKTGAGKSHLLDAVFTEAVARGWDTVRTDAGEFISEFLRVIREKTKHGQDEFRKRYRNVKLLVLDDIQRFQSTKCTASEFQSTIDALLKMKKLIVLGADRPLGEMTLFGQDLISRLSGGLWCPVHSPCPEVRLGILKQLAESRGLDIPAEVLRKIALTAKEDARALSGILHDMKMKSDALCRRMDMPFWEEFRSEMPVSAVKSVTVEDIQTLVAKQFGLESGVLTSGGRSRAVTQPRMLAMWLARKFTRKGLAEIGQAFGCGSHSTVISAQKKVDQLCQADGAIQVREQTRSVKEVIRLIERQLETR